jgi:hypothetical protein
MTELMPNCIETVEELPPAYYSLDDFCTFHTSTLYSLPQTTLSNIQTLIADLGISIVDTVYAEPDHTRPPPKHYRKGRPSRQTAEQQWKVPFVATKLVKKEGIHKTVDTIRASLNKLSISNYDTQSASIMENLTEYWASVALEESMDNTSIMNVIVDVAKVNKTHVALYARLYLDIVAHFSSVAEAGSIDICDDILSQYLASLSTIAYVDQADDFEKFCANNKLNDQRKGLALFIVHLADKNVISMEKIYTVFTRLQDLVDEYCTDASKVNEVDELTENIFVLFSTVIALHLDSDASDAWEHITETIQKYSQFSSKKQLGMSNRSIFKHMDMTDLHR